jgi:hypothetical protein
LEVRQAVEARCGALGKEGSRVIRAPCGGVEECVVCGVEGLEIIRGEEVTLKLVGGAVDGRCELGEVEYIQGAVIYQSLYS